MHFPACRFGHPRASRFGHLGAVHRVRNASGAPPPTPAGRLRSYASYDLEPDNTAYPTPRPIGRLGAIPRHRENGEDNIAFLLDDFKVPTLLKPEPSACFRSRIHDAMITNRRRLWWLFGDTRGWPQKDPTLEQDLVDLGWHQGGFQARFSFDYAVVSPR